MNRKYAIHPGDYAVGESEKFYADMAAGGWLLAKRGVYLSRFVKAEPQQRLYRIELSSPAMLGEDTSLPDEQVALYEECGWHLVTRCGLVHVFTAPAGSGAPEFYSDPRQQAATLKALKRNNMSSWIFAAVIVLIQFLMAAALGGRTGSVTERLQVSLGMLVIRSTALAGLYAAFILLLLYRSIYAAVRTNLLYRRLKSGRALDHAPTKKRRAYRAGNIALWSLCILFALLLAVQLAGSREYDMPLTSDGPYLTLRDFGIEGERESAYYPDRPSTVATSQSLLARQWDTYEGIDRAWIYQDIFRFGSERLARAAAPLLMRNATFSTAFQSFQAQGLDLAFYTDMEYVAVKGNTVWHVTLMLPEETSAEQRAEMVFSALTALPDK